MVYTVVFSSMKWRVTGVFCLKLLLWGVLAVCLPLLLPTVGVVWSFVPRCYIAVCVFLFVLVELSLCLMGRKWYFTYVLLLCVAYGLFYYLPQVVGRLDLPFAFEELHRLARLRINYVFHSMFRVVVAGSIIQHLFVLHGERRRMMEAKLQAELAMLRSQITPHFFFNSLNSIYSLALAKSDRAPEAIITLSDMMRYVLTEAKEEWIDMQQELSYLGRYVELQQLRLPHKTRVDYQVELEGEYRIPPMLLVGFYENAFKYGTSSQREETILIYLKVADGCLRLQTRNAIVIARSAKNSTGNGIANVRRRLDLLYPRRYELLCREEAGYYDVNLTMYL